MEMFCFLEFFELYGRKFNYNCQAIQVVGEGCYVSKESMEENMPPGHRPSYLCIEDPLVPGNDVGKSSYGAIQVQQAFDWAYSQLSRAVRKNCSVGTTLARIVQVDEETINYRTWIKLNHPLRHQEEEEEEEIPALLSCHRLEPDSDQASCRSSSPEVSRQPEAGEDSPDCLEESGSSPGTGRSSPGAAPATPSSAMSISPANSEVGSRLINSNMAAGGGGGSQNSSTSSLPSRGSFNSKQRYSWGKNKKGLPDRADLDHNWRQSASGPASDKSSSSGSSEGRREKTLAESRADLDQNWRNHETPDLANGNQVNALPPSGAKNRKNKSQKSNTERGG